MTHDELREGANDEIYGGWPMILSGLKTLLETGELLTTPGSLRYSEAASMSVETKLVTGVDFVCVPTQDIAAAMDFYENVLGLEPSKRWQRGEEEPMGAEFEPGTVTIALLNTGKLGIEFQASKVPIAYQVDDVEAARAELESRGVPSSRTRWTAASATWPTSPTPTATC